MITVQHTVGLSHSEISGSKVICTSPELIAAYHVLHRLREPRHPPCALTCFFLVESSVKHQNRFKRITDVSYFRLCSWLLYMSKTTVLCVNMSKISAEMIHTIKCVIPDKWRISGSNRWPLACHASALANWAIGLLFKRSGGCPASFILDSG